MGWGPCPACKSPRGSIELSLARSTGRVRVGHLAAQLLELSVPTPWGCVILRIRLERFPIPWRSDGRTWTDKESITGSPKRVNVVRVSWRFSVVEAVSLLQAEACSRELHPQDLALGKDQSFSAAITVTFNRPGHDAHYWPAGFYYIFLHLILGTDSLVRRSLLVF